MRNAQQSSPHEKSPCFPPILPIEPPPPPYEDTTTEPPPDYTTTDSLAVCQKQEIDLPPKYTPNLARRTNHTLLSDPLLTPKVDLFSLHNVRTHGGAKKKKKAGASQGENKEEGKEEGNAEGGDKDGVDGGAGG